MHCWIIKTFSSPRCPFLSTCTSKAICSSKRYIRPAPYVKSLTTPPASSTGTSRGPYVASCLSSCDIPEDVQLFEAEETYVIKWGADNVRYGCCAVPAGVEQLTRTGRRTYEVLTLRANIQTYRLTRLVGACYCSISTYEQRRQRLHSQSGRTCTRQGGGEREIRAGTVRYVTTASPPRDTRDHHIAREELTSKQTTHT